jgi:hypothetical protein
MKWNQAVYIDKNIQSGGEVINQVIYKYILVWWKSKQAVYMNSLISKDFMLDSQFHSNSESLSSFPVHEVIC